MRRACSQLLGLHARGARLWGLVTNAPVTPSHNVYISTPCLGLAAPRLLPPPGPAMLGALQSGFCTTTAPRADNAAAPVSAAANGKEGRKGSGKGSKKRSAKRRQRQQRGEEDAAAVGGHGGNPPGEISVLVSELLDGGLGAEVHKSTDVLQQVAPGQQPRQVLLAAGGAPAAPAAPEVGGGAAAASADGAAGGGGWMRLDEAGPEPGGRIQAGGGAAPPPALLLEDGAHPIRDGDILRPAWSVMVRLRGAGHEAYVVGGTVRDILLGRVPKDYDILTSATPKQVRRLFSHSFVVGKVFPICHVHQEGVVIEVSSFATNADEARIPKDAAAFLIGRRVKGGPPKQLPDLSQSHPSLTWSEARRDNALHRDFTVNALMYDPFSRVLFDYVGAVADCRSRLLRTIAPPEASFRQDPARILRGVRLAARAGLDLDPGTASALASLFPLVASLPQGRLITELGAMLGHGAAARSVELLWAHSALHTLLPQHAAYLKARRVGANYRLRRKPELLFEVLRSLDGHVHPQRPVDPSVWTALLAAPLVAKECASLVARKEAASKRRSEGNAPKQGQGPGILGGGGTAGEEAGSTTGATSPAAEGAGDGGARKAGGAELLGAGGGEEGGEGLATTAGAAGGGDPANEQYKEVYSQVVHAVLDRMASPLDAAKLRALGYGAQEQELRQAAAAWLPAAASNSPPSPVSKAAARRRNRRAKRLLEDAARPDAAADVLIPCAIPKQALAKAALLLLSEVRSRGLPLTAAPGNSQQPAHVAESDAELGGEGSTPPRQHRQHPVRKLKYEERLVCTVLREFAWHERTRLPC